MEWIKFTDPKQIAADQHYLVWTTHNAVQILIGWAVLAMQDKPAVIDERHQRRVKYFTPILPPPGESVPNGRALQPAAVRGGLSKEQRRDID